LLWLSQAAWWLVPSAVALGATGAVALRRVRRRDPRRLALLASQHDVGEARRLATRRRAELKVARAEYRRMVTERNYKRETGVDLSGARRIVRDAERAVRAADAGVRSAYAKRSAARQELPLIKDPEKYPLARVKAQHDSVLRRWLDYETDPAMAIAYPGMTDGSVPAAGEFLVASQRAGWLRPLKDTKIKPEDYSRYRDAVNDLEAAFERAELAVRGVTGGKTTSGWQGSAQHLIERSAEAIERVADAANTFAAMFKGNRRAE
jgi:hypothetical protein